MAEELQVIDKRERPGWWIDASVIGHVRVKLTA
jgi:hypothetical protein